MIHYDFVIESLKKHSEMHEMGERFGYLMKARIKNVAMYVCNVMKNSSRKDKLMVAKLIQWIFSLDDFIDENTLDSDTLREELYRYVDVLETQKGFDSLSYYLLDMVSDLKKYPSYQRFCDVWREEFVKLIEAMLYEYKLKEKGSIPDYNEYIENGKRSIGVYIWFSMLLIMFGEEEDSKILEKLYNAVDCVGRISRLANDFQSDDRERGEGNINSILIFEKKYTKRMAVKKVFDEIDKYKKEFYNRIKNVRTEKGIVEEILKNEVEYIVEFYKRTDFHRN